MSSGYDYRSYRSFRQEHTPCKSDYRVHAGEHAATNLEVLCRDACCMLLLMSSLRLK